MPRRSCLARTTPSSGAAPPPPQKGSASEDFGNQYQWRDSKFLGNSTSPDGQTLSVYYTVGAPGAAVGSVVAVLNWAAPLIHNEDAFAPGLFVNVAVNYGAGAFNPKVSGGALNFIPNWTLGYPEGLPLPPAVVTPPALCSA